MTAHHGKTISAAQIIGERGVALAKERAHAMGFLFTPYGPVEAGIDALIELRDTLTGEVGGRLVAVQIKTREDRSYTAETDLAFEFVCDADDVAYWQKASLPVIVVLVRLSDRSLYWKQAPTKGNPADLEVRRLRISKSADSFDTAAADAIAQLSVDQAQPGIWLPPSQQPDTLLFNAVRVCLPATIQVAATTHRHGKDALGALLDHSDHPPAEWVARGGRLVTFLDIENTVLRHVTDTGSIDSFSVSEFSLHDDEDEQRLFVELLNRTLRAQLDPMLSWSKRLKLYHFPPDGPAIDRTIRYMSLKNETARAVVKAKRRPDGSVSYVRHSAFSGRFWREFDDWFLTVEPTYVFTRDGVRPDRFAGERISKLKRLENNAAIRGQFVMWRSLLTGFGQVPNQGDLLGPAPGPAPLLRFESLDMIGLPLSVPDDLWRSRDAIAPQNDEEELPL
ncbi:MAG: DUF4365 domain-containing protein [Alphaproteobacteria bacterium]|nr:DUF4365 domain-containing protein [Alphaproteobacteria bacterium]MBV8412260.1 DUF4365 domain-containing protein [Alphaproteobacteria bacterium]